MGAQDEARRAPRTVGLAAACLLLLAIALCAALALFARSASAAQGPFIWDEDGDRLDDRIESVNLLGYSFAFENADTLAHKRIDVVPSPGGLLYTVYVLFDHPVTTADQTSLALVGMPTLWRFESIDAVRSVGTFAQLQAVAALAGVTRVEAVPVVYGLMREAVAAAGVRDPSDRVFPTWQGTGGPSGEGQVIAFLDTGINDAPEGTWPGHEALSGRCLGGALILTGDSAVDTPKDASINPSDHGGAITASHGTHVASIALGTGGPSGYAAGVAPAARFVDVKVLSDLGTGTAIAEALDWCVHNRTRSWGGPAGYDGIDVINLSLSSTDQTDGNDMASLVADRAVQLGMVVVAAVGNGGQTAFVPSPAGGSRVLAVGAIDDQRTPVSDDDAVATFSNRGPRADDGDGDPANEQKPDLMAPGVAILAANGDETTDGAQYQRMSGTSMSTAFVSGCVAALRSAYPALTPEGIAELLKSTALRRLSGIPVGQGGSDPRWYSSIGFGAVDLYAAKLEQEQPARSQVDRLELTATDDAIDATLATQREMGAAYFVFERASDAGGVAGSFAPYDSVGASGHSSLAGADDRAVYARNWSIPLGERGQTFWYRVSYTEGGVRWDGPARPFTSPLGPPAATLELTIVHNAYDHDLAGDIVVGPSSDLRTSLSGGNATVSQLHIPLPGSSAADSSDWANGAAATGNVAWFFSVPVPHGAADAWLPPSGSAPWQLRVTEGGYLDRSGRITAMRLVWHGPSGDVTYDGGPLPVQTLEGQTAYAMAPWSLASVNTPSAPHPDFGSAPNPVRAGDAVVFWSGKREAGELRVYDLNGRQVGHAALARASDRTVSHWSARDAAGQPLEPGVYFARMGNQAGYRVLVLKR